MEVTNGIQEFTAYLEAEAGGEKVLSGFNASREIDFALTNIDPNANVCYMVIADKSSGNLRYAQVSLDEADLERLKGDNKTKALGKNIAEVAGIDVPTFPSWTKIMRTVEGFAVEDKYRLIPGNVTMIGKDMFNTKFNDQKGRMELQK